MRQEKKKPKTKFIASNLFTALESNMEEHPNCLCYFCHDDREMCHILFNNDVCHTILYINNFHNLDTLTFSHVNLDNPWTIAGIFRKFTTSALSKHTTICSKLLVDMLICLTEINNIVIFNNSYITWSPHKSHM